jgi:hypothetical protein
VWPSFKSARPHFVILWTDHLTEAFVIRFVPRQNIAVEGNFVLFQPALSFSTFCPLPYKSKFSHDALANTTRNVLPLKPPCIANQRPRTKRHPRQRSHHGNSVHTSLACFLWPIWAVHRTRNRRWNCTGLQSSL